MIKFQNMHAQELQIVNNYVIGIQKNILVFKLQNIHINKILVTSNIVLQFVVELKVKIIFIYFKIILLFIVLYYGRLLDMYQTFQQKLKIFIDKIQVLNIYQIIKYMKQGYQLIIIFINYVMNLIKQHILNGTI